MKGIKNENDEKKSLHGIRRNGKTTNEHGLVRLIFRHCIRLLQQVSDTVKGNYSYPRYLQSSCVCPSVPPFVRPFVRPSVTNHKPREVQRVLSRICLRTNRKALVACNFNCRFENEGLLKVTANPVHCICCNISKTVPHGVVVTTDH